MSLDWPLLQEELNLWQSTGLTLPLWWRDDDAVAVTPQLERLRALSEELGLPVHLAVIPRDAEDELATYVCAETGLIPVVHGWAHQNHAPKGEKKAEFRSHRPIDRVMDDAEASLKRLRGLFGEQLLPLFVPPWNRIALQVKARLHDLGYLYLSTATPRENAYAAPNLEQVNTHIDPIDWHGSRGLCEPGQLISQTVNLLRDRREGRADNSEPFGVLTHHLVHDEEVWVFTKALIQHLLDGPGVPWIAARDAHNEGQSK